VFWKLEGAGAFQRVPLNAVPNIVDRFQGAIPAQAKGSTVTYYISARDTKGKVGKFPFRAPQELLQFHVN
jgi:hypothetical protein